MNEKIVVVHADDWTAIYIDGKSVSQDHSFRIDEIVSMADADTPICRLHYQFSDALMDYAWEHGRLPDTYEEAKQYDPELP